MSASSFLAQLAKNASPALQAEARILGQELDEVLHMHHGQTQPGTAEAYFENMQWKTAYGEVLPHELARLADDGLSIATGAGDTLPAWDGSLADTYWYGMDVDLTNGYIYLKRLPRNAIVVVFYDVDFSANAVGQRYLKLSTNLSAALHSHYKTNEGASYVTTIEGTHFIRCVADLQWVKMVVGHTSTGTLTVNARFTAVRIR